MRKSTKAVSRTAPTRPRGYPVRRFDLSRVRGLSKAAIRLHLGLYEGYVKAVNGLLDEDAKAVAARRVAAPPEASACRSRRYAFEWNGMMLHELFFEALYGPGAPALPTAGRVATAARHTFGGLARWRDAVVELSQARGVGWIVCTLDRRTGRLDNQWVDLHHYGVQTGAVPVLALDFWEHAWLLDFSPKQRAEYCTMLWNQIDWSKVEARAAG